MKKEIVNLIYNTSLLFFNSLNFKLKKTSNGILFSKKIPNIEIEGGFGFGYDTFYINYGIFCTLNIRFLEVEDIYENILKKHNVNNFIFPTVGYTDIELKNDPGAIFKHNDFEGIEAQTLKILERFQSFIIPVAEKYISIPYWADYFEKNQDTLYELNTIGPFYSYVRDNYTIKHLIILKLAGSPLFEKALAEKRNFFENLFEGKPISEGITRMWNIYNDLEEILSKTEPKYSISDLTPPYRFVQSEKNEVDKKVFKPKVKVNGVEIETDINGFEINKAQKKEINQFLKNIESHFKNIKNEILAERAHEKSQGETLGEFGETLYEIAQNANILNKANYDQLAVEYFNIQHIAINVEQAEAVIALGSEYTDWVFNAHLDMKGNILIITSK